MKVHVDEDRCKGHGVCCSLCPQVFELTDHGYAVALASEVPPEFHELVHTAVDQCPEGAVSISD